MSSIGKVLRFDEEKGYGFIVSDSDEEHVFFHVNEARIEESVIRPGMRVIFDARNGDRGKYAVNVEGTKTDAGNAGEPLAADIPGGLDSGERSRLTREELLDEFTELIITAAPEVSGREIANIRQGFVALAAKYGWVTPC
ncbi:cold-shock protein [Nocardia sp. NPDC055002]